MLNHPHIEITTCCNLHCAGCWTQDNPSPNGQHMPMRTFLVIVDKMIPLKGITLHNGGEPTLHPQLPQMVRWLSHEKQIPVIRIVSNALAQPTNYYIDLFANGLTRLEISIDSLCPELSDRLRHGTDVERLAETTRVLCYKFPNQIGVISTVSRINAPVMEKLLWQLHQLGVRKVSLQPLERRNDRASVLSPGERLELGQRIAKVVAQWPGMNVNLNYFSHSTKRCQVPQYSPNINVNGYMTPCCNIPFPEDLNYGNLAEQPFEKVWQSTAANNFRREFERGIPSLCNYCPANRKNIADV